MQQVDETWALSRKAVEEIAAYIGAVSGANVTDEELARALSMYFVKKEILDSVVMLRDGDAG